MVLEEAIAQEKVLVNRTQYVYLYNPRIYGRNSSGTSGNSTGYSGDSNTSSDDGDLTRTSRNGNDDAGSGVSYDEAARELRDRYKRDSGGYPNPNNRLHTGGGVVER